MAIFSQDVPTLLTFKLGTSDKAIGVQDLTRVSLAGITALDERTTQLQQKQNELDQLRLKVSELETVNQAMERRLAALEKNASLEKQATTVAQRPRRTARH